MSRFGERFGDGQYSLVSFLFTVRLLTVPRAVRTQPFFKVRHLTPCPMESAPLYIGYCVSRINYITEQTALDVSPLITFGHLTRWCNPTFIWTCRFNLLHSAVTFHHFFTVSLWAQNLPFRKSYPPP